eukprot:352737-Chlamydomonas_euryale.AAC.3
MTARSVLCVARGRTAGRVALRPHSETLQQCRRLSSRRGCKRQRSPSAAPLPLRSGAPAPTQTSNRGRTLDIQLQSKDTGRRGELRFARATRGEARGVVDAELRVGVRRPGTVRERPSRPAAAAAAAPVLRLVQPSRPH